MTRVKKFNSEDQLHQQAAGYLRMRYPHVIFRSDFAAGIKLTPGQAVKHRKLQSGRAYPDMFLAEPRKVSEILSYCGLYIELKAEGAPLYKKDGTLVSNQHIQEQYEVLLELTAKGYRAEFAQGFEQFKEIVDDYLGSKYE